MTTSVYRANLDGTGAAAIFDNRGAIEEVAVDAAGGHLFFSEGNAIWRAGLDGGTPEVILPTANAGAIELPATY
jgi:hypothetical protein